MILRLDDLGASSKQFERHSHRWALDWGPFKTSWGPYREMTAVELDRLFRLVAGRGRTITAAITACWVESTGALTPYPAKYPEQATVIQRWIRTGTVEVANHGLTHCQVGKHLPGFFGNRRYHREFLDDMTPAAMAHNLERSQAVFRSWLGHAPRRLVPPGGMFPDWGIPLAKLWGLDLWSESCEVFHDREFVKGHGWVRLEEVLG